jgi:hypothetical protein
VFVHDGENYSAISHAIRIDPVTRSGIVINSSSGGFAMRLAADWLYWKTGNLSYIGFRLPQLMRTVGIGAALIVLFVADWVIWDAHSRRRRAG